MYGVTAVVQGYDAGTDTASVLLLGAGVVDVAIDGVAIAADIDRKYMTNGQIVTVALPDAHRLCAAQIIALGPFTPGQSSGDGSGTPTMNKSGQAYILTDGSGFGCTTINYGPYTTKPTGVFYAVDPRTNPVPTLYGSSISNTSMTVCIFAGTPAKPNSYVYFTWSINGMT